MHDLDGEYVTAEEVLDGEEMADYLRAHPARRLNAPPTAFSQPIYPRRSRVRDSR